MNKFINLILILLLSFGWALIDPAYAAASSSSQQQLDAIKQQQAQIEKERKQKEADAAYLNSTLKKLDDSISRTTSAVKSTDEQLTQTTNDIADAQNALQQSQQKSVEIKNQLETLISDLYQMDAGQSPILEVFSASNISESVEMVQYRSTVNTEFDKLAVEEQATQEKITQTKTLLEQRQAELAQLKDQQEATKEGLQTEQQNKNQLLTVTNSNIDKLKKQEAELIAREREVEAQIQAALKARVGGKVVGGVNKPVKKGDIIGYQGNTGNSTGSHLHFTVMQNCDMGQTVNPLNYLGKSFAWPLSDYRLTQGYGATDFALTSGFYASNFHNGVDLSEYAGAPIHAVADGTMILKQYFGGYGNAIIIDHNNGLCTLYGHMR